MAEERIDIKVTDAGADKAAKNLRTIANEADRGQNFVARLSAALSAINSSSVDKLARAAAQNTNALARETAAQAKLTAAQNAGAVAAARVATENQRLATEIARTEAATARASAANTNAAAAAERLAMMQARAQGAATAAVGAENALGSAVEQAKLKFDAGEISIRQYVAAIQAANIAEAGAVGSMNAAGVAGAGLGAQHDKLTASGGRLRGQTANIAAQMNDLGVQFAMAAQSGNPLQMVFMALIQQGSQLSYIASTMEGGFAGLGKQMAGMLLRFAPLVIAIGFVVGALKTLQAQFNDNRPADEFVKSLGLTDKELKKLGDTSITLGDTVMGLWDAFYEAANLSPVIQDITDFFSSAWSKSLSFVRLVFVGFYGLVKGLLAGIGGILKNVVVLINNTIRVVVNSISMLVEGAVNLAIDGINLMAKGYNMIAGVLGGDLVGSMKKVSFGINNMSDGMLKFTEIDIAGAVGDGVRDADAKLSWLSQRGEHYANQRRNNRLRARADELIGDRSGGRTSTPRAGAVDHTAENRAAALLKVNTELDNEIARMRMLKDERAVQQRMDAIEESLAQKKIKLNDAEKASILGKVKAIEAYKYVQSESDRILEDAVSPARTWAAVQEAANDLLARGAINADQYNRAIGRGAQAYAEATDPLHQFKEALEAQERTMGLYGVQLERANYLESIRQKLVADGYTGDALRVKMLSAETAELVKKNDALMQQQFIQSQVAGVVDPLAQYSREMDAQSSVYAELERMRQGDLISEDNYQRAKHALFLKYNEDKLQAASSFFGALADVTAQGHGVVGAISKAAAVAEATIQGYVAAQRALASAPPPWNFIAAATVGLQTGMNVAKILSTNVGSYATGGQFVVGGKSGVDANNINMNVTKGERVTIETMKQQRANDNAAAPVSPVVNNKVVNLFDEKSFIGAMDSDEGEEVVMNIIRRRRGDTNQILGNG